MKRRIVFMLLALVLGIGWLALTPAVQAEDPVSKPGVYSGYSPVLYDDDNNYKTINYKLNSQYVTMRDGTKLAVDIFRPTLNGQLVTTPLPVVWMHSPYNRRYYPSAGPILAINLYPGAARGLIKYGYVVAVVDARGIYASYGSTVAYNRGQWLAPAFWDAYDITEWFAAQPWSTGKIGMWGCSATGGTQLQAAASMPPHLAAIFPMSCEGDYYGSGSGVTAGTITPAPAYPYWVDQFDPDAVPVDEDAGGLMMQAAKQEHKAGVDIGYVPFRDSISPWILEKKGISVKWNLFSSPHIYFNNIEKSGLAMYNAGNWLDSVGLRWGPIFRFNNLNNPAKLILGPGGHCIWWTAYSPKPYPLTFPIVTEELRWYDHWLKGIQNGIMDEPPVYFFTYNAPVGKEWRFAWQWPLPNEERINYYLGPGPSEGEPSGVNNGTLSMAHPGVVGAKDVYTVDYSVTAANRSQKGLTYTTAPLAADVEVTGHAVVELWISSTATDGDFLAYLEDVAPNGSSTSFTVEGSLRASNRALHFPPYDNSGLPYHRTYEEDQKPLHPGKPVELVFNVGPTSYIFKAGHRIRLIITCADPTLTPRLDPPPVVSVYTNPIYRSHITLPIGGGPVGAYVRIEPGALDLHSQGEFTAFITFPKWLDKGYVKDINLNSIQCNGATAVSAKLHKDTLIAKFKRQDLDVTGAGHRVKLTVSGKFGSKFDYGQISFEGSDTVRIIRQGK